MAEMEQKTRCRKDLPRLCKIWQIITRDPKTGSGDPCVQFPGHLIRKPDPCIYSQFMLMQLKQPVTWDNPDVAITLNGVAQDTYNLTAGTEYTLEITVHNSSRDKPADGTTVHVRWIEFGAGGQTRHPIASLTANVPIWPAVAVVTTQWRTPDTPGHYCIEVELNHPDDANPANNRGWNNTQVYAANSPVVRPIRIFNEYLNGCPPVAEGGGPYLRPSRVFYGWAVLGAVAGGFLFKLGPDRLNAFENIAVFAAAGYVALAIVGLILESIYAWLKRKKDPRHSKQPDGPKRTPCNLVEITVDSYEFNDKIGKDFDPDAAFHGKAAIWNARVEPAQFLFNDNEVHRDVELKIDAPDDPGPAGVFNVNVMQGGVPAGGVTVTVTRGGP